MPTRSATMIVLATLLTSACAKDEAPPARSNTSADANARRDRAASVPAAEKKPIDPAQTGSIRGVVHFAGKAPQRKPIDVSAAGGCHPEGQVLTEQVIVNDGRLQNVVVRVKHGHEGWIVPPAPSSPAVMDQNGCVYQPHVLAVRVGQPVIIKNSDQATHNVNARPQRRKNESFNQVQIAGAADLNRTFGEEEVAMSFECNLHPWMKAWVAVLDHPFFAVSGADGSFTLEGLPAGEYELEAWHERLGRQTASVTVTAGAAADASFTFK